MSSPVKKSVKTSVNSVKSEKVRKYLRYKNLCDALEDHENSCNPHALDNMDREELTEYKKYITDLQEDFKKCSERRLAFRSEFIAPENYNSGHQHQIDKAKRISDMCSKELENIDKRFLDLAYEFERTKKIEKTKITNTTENIDEDSPTVSFTKKSLSKKSPTKKSTKKTKTARVVDMGAIDYNSIPETHISSSGNSPASIGIMSLMSHLAPYVAEVDKETKYAMIHIVLKDVVKEAIKKDPNDPMLTEDQWKTLKTHLDNYDPEEFSKKVSSFYGYILDTKIGTSAKTSDSFNKIRIKMDALEMGFIVPNNLKMSQLETHLCKKMFGDEIQFTREYKRNAIIEEVVEYDGIIEVRSNLDSLYVIGKSEWKKNEKYFREKFGLEDGVGLETANERIRLEVDTKVKISFKKLRDDVKRHEIQHMVHFMKNREFYLPRTLDTSRS